MPNAEVILWSFLRKGRQGGLRFRRQHPLGPYITDFACIAARLVIEVDGPFGRSMNFETDAVEWIPVDQVTERPLHAGFAAAWPHLRAIVDGGI
jgi:8-oxo-dGTP diphosphatase